MLSEKRLISSARSVLYFKRCCADLLRSGCLHVRNWNVLANGRAQQQVQTGSLTLKCHFIWQSSISGPHRWISSCAPLYPSCSPTFDNQQLCSYKHTRLIKQKYIKCLKWLFSRQFCDHNTLNALLQHGKYCICRLSFVKGMCPCPVTSEHEQLS